MWPANHQKRVDSAQHRPGLACLPSCSLGLGVEGSGFRVQGLGFGVEGLACRTCLPPCPASHGTKQLVCRAAPSGIPEALAGWRVTRSGGEVDSADGAGETGGGCAGTWFRVRGSGFRVEGVGLRV